MAVLQRGSAEQIQEAAVQETLVSSLVCQVTSSLQGSTRAFSCRHCCSPALLGEEQLHSIILSPSGVLSSATRASWHCRPQLSVRPSRRLAQFSM